MIGIDALFLTRYGRQGASSRYRFLQYFPLFEEEGINCTYRPLFDDQYLQEMYDTGSRNYWLIGKGYVQRVYELLRTRQYDIIIIEKELLPYCPALFERFLGKLDIPYIVDYDDAVFHNYDLSENPVLRRLLGKKIDVVMREADVVVAGNEYLASRARKAGATHVEIIPTVIDLDRYPHVPLEDDGSFTIGWIGSPTTAQYVEGIAPALREVCQDREARVILVGAGSVEFPGVPFEVREWSEETEIDDITSFDAGIMPLEDTPWERGKCGLKLIQYMGCGKPVVASPVGVNAEIIEQGFNGFHAKSKEDWIQSLSKFIDDIESAGAMGTRGREFVKKNYCLNKASSVWVTLLEQLACND